jgi:DMSO/TMAO reductase YedYZ molybdopterin-dependent catalytic subunit
MNDRRPVDDGRSRAVADGSPVDGARRRALGRAAAALGATLLAGCDRLSMSEWFPRVLSAGEKLSARVAPLVTGRDALAKEYPPSALSPEFRSNGTARPMNAEYQALAAANFDGYALTVDGLVERPLRLSLADLRALPSRTQITRHDCVEGWSAIGKWKGARLSAVLDAARLKPDAHFVVFHCFDPMEDDGTEPYYESIGLDDAFHEQTLLAYDLNDHALPVKNGAPVRLRVERQLGYKHAKYIHRVEVVSSFAPIRGGNGGYWEDQGYQWYAGI